MRAALCVTALLATAVAVDRSNFRKCSDTSFCRRHRGKTPEDTVRFHVPRRLPRRARLPA